MPVRAVADRLLPFLATIIAAAVLSAPVAAQNRNAPRRPPLPNGADTNSVTAYSQYGVSQLHLDTRKAVAAFYWATRLDPSAAEQVYAYRSALLLDNRHLLRGLLTDDRGVQRLPEMRRIDSLMQRALMLNPFFHTWLDDVIITEYITTGTRQELRQQGSQNSDAEVDYAVNTWLRDNESGWRPFIDYARGQFNEALALWAEQAHSRPRDAMPHARRARAMYLSGRLDSARAELTSALRLARASDAEVIRFSYESKAAWEFALGRIYEQQGQADSARAAYERALVEDLGYYPAHVQLGQLRLEARDTAAALRELRRAVEVKEDEYIPQLNYGVVLGQAGQMDSAEAHLARAAALEPWAAAPWLMLGAVQDARGDRAGAIRSFEGYLARAARNDMRRTAIQQRLADLRRDSH